MPRRFTLRQVFAKGQTMSSIHHDRPGDAHREILTERQAAALLQVSTRTLNRWRHTGKLRYARTGRIIRYRKQDLDRFVHDHIEPKPE